MKITNKLNLPNAFVDAVTREYTYKDKRYSVTTMLKGIKEIMLTRRHHTDIEQDVSDMIWLIFGTAIHKVLEDSRELNDELKETKIEVLMPNGYTLSGQQDLYSESKKRITDYKTGTVWKVMYNDWSDYRKQCLIYAWMFRHIGFPCDNADIVMILKDWSSSKAKFEHNYPPHPVHIEHFEFSDKDFEEIEKELNEKFALIEKYENVPDDELPICTPEERWATPTQYAVYKKGGKRALKNCSTMEEATKLAESVNGEVVVKQGEDKKCCEYCSCCTYCNYWKRHYESKK